MLGLLLLRARKSWNFRSQAETCRYTEVKNGTNAFMFAIAINKDKHACIQSYRIYSRISRCRV